MQTVVTIGDLAAGDPDSYSADMDAGTTDGDDSLDVSSDYTNGATSTDASSDYAGAATSLDTSPLPSLPSPDLSSVIPSLDPLSAPIDTLTVVILSAGAALLSYLLVSRKKARS